MVWILESIIIGLVVSIVIISVINYRNNKVDKCKEESIIKVLQEVACDYHVRVYRSWWGNLIIDGDQLVIDSVITDDLGCFEMNSNNTIIVGDYESVIFEHDENGKLYFINFRVLGKCYLAYGDNTVSAWLNVIKKARAVNKKFFYGHLDRQRI